MAQSKAVGPSGPVLQPAPGTTMDISELFQEIGRMHAEKMALDKVITSQQAVINDLTRKLGATKEE